MAGDAVETPMVDIPTGEFVMGSDGTQALEDERPSHRVWLDAFSIDVHEVTTAQYAGFLAATTRLAPWQWETVDLLEHGDRPVIGVDWRDAEAFCTWKGKRLPTEAEWEKAARGTDQRKYPWGNQRPDRTRAQFGAAYNETVPVGRARAGASPHGALDMAGNVWEWVASAYRPYPYRSDDGREDRAAGPVRGTRGGGHDSPAEEITTTQRGRNLSRNPASGHHNIGFRCAR